MSEPTAPPAAGIAPNPTEEHPPVPAPIETVTPTATTAEPTEAGPTAVEEAASLAGSEPVREETVVPLVKTSEPAPEAPSPPVVNQTVPTAPAPTPSTNGASPTSPTAPTAPEVPETILEKTPSQASPFTPPIISSGPSWPALDKDHPLTQFQSRLPEILKDVGHSLIWGITLSAKEPIPFHTTLVLQKFLRANSNNVDAAYNQLLATLKWRKDFNPEVVCDEEFSERKFNGLGYVMKTKTKDGEKIITYNIYGSCKDPKRTFGDLDSFLRWRIALMEIGVKALDLPNATAPIPDYNPTSPSSAVDPYQMIQLHDYQGVSFLRMDSSTKLASKKTIQVMADYYPELLSVKYFVNVPVVMSWVFTAMRPMLSRETMRKFRVLSSGKGVASDLGDEVPTVYGGKGSDLAEVGLCPKLFKDTPPQPAEKERRPSKKASMVSLDRLREKVVETVYSTAETKVNATAPAPAPNATAIQEVKGQEVATEKSNTTPTVPTSGIAPETTEPPPVPAKDESPAPAPEVVPDTPAKDELASPVDAAAGNTTEGSSTSMGEPSNIASEVQPTSGVVAPEKMGEPVPLPVEEPEAEKEECNKNNSFTPVVVGVDEAVNVEKKLEESNVATQETKPGTEATTA